MAKLMWKRVEDDWSDPPSKAATGYTYRARVPGGWLVSVWAGTKDNQKWGGGITYYPDPDERWVAAVDEVL